MQDKQPELDPAPLFSPRTIRLLKLSILVMTILIAAGLIALVIGMKQQADKLFAKQGQSSEVLTYQLSEGTAFKALHLQEADSIWIEGIRQDGRIELLKLGTDGTVLRRLILEQAQ